MIVTTNIGSVEEKESLAISAEGASSNTKKVRQRAPRACLNCRDLKVSRNSKSYWRKFTNVVHITRSNVNK